jgi:2-dehydropantoate 2-reductase
VSRAAQRHVGIVGSGSIGSLLAAHLTLSGHQVTVVDGWFPHVERIRDDGVEIQAPDERVEARLNALNVDELDRVEGRIDVLLVAVKAYESAMAVRLMEPLLHPDSVVVPVQNGMTDDMFTRLVPADRLLGCSVHVPAELTEPGKVTRYVARNRRTFSVGEPRGGTSARAERLAEIFEPAGVTEVTGDLMATKWAKLAVNMMANAPAGITGWTTHRLWSDPASVPLLVRAAGETLAVAEASGVRAGQVFGCFDPGLFRAALTDPAAAEEAGQALGQIARERTGASESRPSLLQDVDRGRRTEVRYLNGFVAARGREVGVATPVNDALLTLVEDIDRRRLGKDPANLDRLRELAGE